MGPFIALMFFIGAAVAWAFFAFQPEYANKRALSVFNWSVIAAGGMICLAWYFNMQSLLGAEAYSKYRIAFALIGSLGIESVWLLVMFVLRNFWIFKPPRPGRGGWF